MSHDGEAAERLAAAADQRREEIVRDCLDWGNLPDIAGAELPVAEAVADAFRCAGLDVRIQNLGPSSANVIGRRRGSGGTGARSLILNSHLDTEGWTPREDHRRLRGTWRDGDALIGKGLVNAKVHLVAQLHALAIAESVGNPLIGDVTLTAVAQETGGDLVQLGADAWAGPHMLEGTGAHRLLETGLTADYALVGEPTGFAVAAAQAGYVRFRVTIPGFVPYTPFIERGASPESNPNPFERAGGVLTALTDWAVVYEQQHQVPFRDSIIIPKAQVNGIRRGSPIFTEHSDSCLVFVDVRTPPDTPAIHVVRSLSAAVAAADPTADVETIDLRSGYVAKGADDLIDAVIRAHELVFGRPPDPPHPSQISMWQDTNAFNASGIPSISYGIRPIRESATRERNRGALIDDILELVTVYALVIGDICGTDPNE